MGSGGERDEQPVGSLVMLSQHSTREQRAMPEALNIGPRFLYAVTCGVFPVHTKVFVLIEIKKFNYRKPCCFSCHHSSGYINVMHLWVQLFDFKNSCLS